MASSASQKPGQLFETTAGSLTSMPSTTRPEQTERHREPMVVVGVETGAPCSRSVGSISSPSGLDGDHRPGLGQLGGEIARGDRSPCSG